MKNKIIILLISILFFVPLMADNLNIQSLSISVDKKTKVTIFKNQVVATDEKNNQLFTDYAEYNKELGTLKSIGKTNVITSNGYTIEGEDIIFDNDNKLMRSNNPTIVKDLEQNTLFLDNFEYSTSKSFFKSFGKIKVEDSKSNKYNFTQIYIDEKKKEIVGTDAKTFLNAESLKLDGKNKPRVFSNTVNIYNDKTKFTKSIFSLCDYRENDKCPPWSLQASEMIHDKKKKTIYYDNAVIKVYDLPIFYTPKLSHPDPTVKRRSGFLVPYISRTKNLGSGLEVPYYWAVDNDKDFTVRNKFYVSEHPLFLGEYRQAFAKSNLFLDFGYTEGYKKETATKKLGNKSHFFSKFIKNFKGENEFDNSIEITVQNVSDDKYLKLYKIKSNLVEYEENTLENSFAYNRESETSYLGLKASAYETLKENYNDKHEYVLPDLIFDKNVFNNNLYGNLDFTSNLRVHNYDTNKTTKFLVNDLDWKFRTNNFGNGFKGNLLGRIRNVNYEAKNTSGFSEDPEQQVFGALGYLTKLDLFKQNNSNDYFLTPKFLVRYAPGNMRKSEDSVKLDVKNIFNLDRLNSDNNFESGLSSTIGFDYGFKNKQKEFNFSVGQVINEKENKDMPDSSSLNEKLSDLVGETYYQANENLTFNYNFAIDQNYDELNYSETGIDLNFDTIKFNIDHLRENKHIGKQEYIKSNMQYTKDNGLFSFEMKRNIITNSAEYYNLSYEYLNDCLRAGLVYRREFYNDSELEPENSLLFKITLTPFGDIAAPSFVD